MFLYICFEAKNFAFQRKLKEFCILFSLSALFFIPIISVFTPMPASRKARYTSMGNHINPNRYCIGSFWPAPTLKKNYSMMAWEKNIFLKKAYPSKMHLESLSTVGIYQYNKVFCDKKKQKATKKTQKGEVLYVGR